MNVMDLALENPHQIPLSDLEEHLLRHYLIEYKRVILTAEFGGGLSGSRIFEIRPVRHDGLAELPAVIKMGPANLIEREWSAYQAHIRFRMPNAAAITDDPMVFPDTGLWVMRQQLVGDGAADVISLRDYLARETTSIADVERTFRRLFNFMDSYWRDYRLESKFLFASSYDSLLPVNLRVRSESGLASNSFIDGANGWHLVDVDEAVRLTNFFVHKSNPKTSTITLRTELESFSRPSRFLRIEAAPTVVANARSGEQFFDVSGLVVANRSSFFQQTVTHLEHVIPQQSSWVWPGEASIQWQVANPISHAERWLEHRTAANVGPIHGDFNLENVLIEPESGTLNIIDFADARVDHVLHDMLRLETEIITKLLPMEIAKAGCNPHQALISLFRRLDEVVPMSGQAHRDAYTPAIAKSLTTIRLIRQAAFRYLAPPRTWSEYFAGLRLYLVGATKFKNLAKMDEHPLPILLAIWGAVLADQYAQGGEIPEEMLGLVPASRPQQPVQSGKRLRHFHLPESFVPPFCKLPSTVYGVRGRNEQSVANRDVLPRMAKALNAPGGVVVLQGMSGTGKSHYANEFVNRYGHNFTDGIFWLNFDRPDLINKEVALSGKQGPIGHFGTDYQHLSLADQVKLVEAYWENDRTCLLIFDNCESSALFEAWRPRSEKCRVIVTSRFGGWSDLPEQAIVPLSTLSEAESITLLRHYFVDASDAELAEIAKAVGHLPLTLCLAGTYLSQRRGHIDLTNYILGLKDPANRGRLLAAGDHLLNEYEGTIAGAIAFSLQRLSAFNTTDMLANRLLAMLAYSAPGEVVTFELVESLLKAEATSSIQIEAALERLVYLGLIEKIGAQLFRLQRLVREHLRHFMMESAAVEASVTCAYLIPVIRQHVEQKQTIALQGWERHLRAFAEAAITNRWPAWVTFTLIVADYLMQSGAHKVAQQLLEQAATVLNEQPAPDNDQLRDTLLLLGQSYQFLAEPIQARNLYDKALDVQMASYGENHALTAEIWNHIGFLLQRPNGGNLVLAKEAHEKALAIRREVLPAGHPQVADSLCNLAFVAFERGDFAEVMALLNEALAINEVAFPDGHPDLIKIHAYLAETELQLKHWSKAKNRLLMVLEARRHHYGPAHRDVGETLLLLGQASQELGNLADARSYWVQAAQIMGSLGNYPQTMALLAKWLAEIGPQVSDGSEQ